MDGIEIRTGPGTDYEKDESGELVKGEKLHVLEERNGWIRFRVTPNDVGWSGWVKKDLTVAEEEWLSKKESERIRAYGESGLLLRVEPLLNEAYVDRGTWDKFDYWNKEEFAKTLAFYCGRKKGTNLNWVMIKDSSTGKKLAKYSENWGFTIY